ncbi:MAG: 30S ribosomal protein S20 [Verrucomicrobiaceae bacterium]|nr:30S ribosomal protein S20 [Verrucomicrobiaceae bacterium]
MANIASNQKSIRQTKTRNLRNSIARSRIRTFRNRVANAIKSGDLELAKKELSLFASVADKAGKKNVIHKNKASRLKGRLAKSINAAAASKA